MVRPFLTLKFMHILLDKLVPFIRTICVSFFPSIVRDVNES